MATNIYNRTFVYVCIHLYTFVYVCIRLYTFVYICIRLCMFVYFGFERVLFERVPFRACSLRFDVPTRAAVSPLLSQGDDTLGGGEQASMEAPIYDVASSCLVCGVEFFDVGHRTVRRGVELFDVASNSSTWHRTFRRGVEMFDVGHRNVAGECPLTSNIPTFRYRRIRQRSHSCCATVLLGRYRKTLSGLASLFRWGRRIAGGACEA